ncbi:MAG: hypothetical protein EOM72_13095 [Opitutae bacterium]|nr:hypothetical protein [Opitutae bacterium]
MRGQHRPPPRLRPIRNLGAPDHRRGNAHLAQHAPHGPGKHQPRFHGTQPRRGPLRGKHGGRRPMTFRHPLCAFLLLCAAALPLRAAAAETPAPAPAALRKGDALLVRIDGVGGGLPEYRDIVDSSGKIEMPFLGLLAAEGKTLAAVEAEISAAYATARLTTNASVHLSLITHFEPPPDRSNLVRIQDPRRPIPAEDMPAPR